MKLKEALADGNLVITLSGPIDESSADVFQKLLPKVAKRHVEFVLLDVESINSLGARAFATLLKQLDAQTSFELRSCPPVVVDYLNLLPSMLFADRAVSVSVPYRCVCGRSERPVFEIEALNPNEEFATVSCPGCRKSMNAEVTAAEYLEFMTAK